jgi:hypothetical protein
MKKLKGSLTSGILFIGDPAYMAADMSPPGAHEIVDPSNPFRNWDSFVADFPEEGKALEFPGSSETGRGVAIQTHRITGQYELEHVFDETGKLKQIIVHLKD